MSPSNLPYSLPSSDELVDSDDFPVDNEDQNFLPNVLLFLLEYIWKHRDDWYFGVDMGVFHETSAHPKVPVVPDGFLSLGVDRRKGGKSRRSYIVWQENNIPPILTLEVVSHTPGGEYDDKMAIYAKLKVLYYVIYNPEFWRRDGHLPFEVYKLVNGNYVLQIGEPFWMPEIGLGIGRCTLPNDSLNREILTWYDAQRDRYLTEAETEWNRADAERQRADAEQQRADAQQQRADVERQRAERLAERLRQLGEEI
jgi:Uma2 family endonuclease